MNNEKSRPSTYNHSVRQQHVEIDMVRLQREFNGKMETGPDGNLHLTMEIPTSDKPLVSLDALDAMHDMAGPMLTEAFVSQVEKQYFEALAMGVMVKQHD